MGIQIAGIIPLGTSLDAETATTRNLNCWDAPKLLTPDIEKWTAQEPTPQFEPDLTFCDFLIDIGFGKDDCPADVRDYWRKTIRQNYQGDDGRRRIRMASINLRDRDGLHPRLFDVRCPVMWLHVSCCIYFSHSPKSRFCIRVETLTYHSCREPRMLSTLSPTPSARSSYS